MLMRFYVVVCYVECAGADASWKTQARQQCAMSSLGNNKRPHAEQRIAFRSLLIDTKAGKTGGAWR